MKLTYFLKIVIFYFLFKLTLLNSCTKPCELNLTECSEVAPTNEACLAFFERWFYDQELKECEKIAYSGCSSKGFESEEACLACECN